MLGILFGRKKSTLMVLLCLGGLVCFPVLSFAQSGMAASKTPAAKRADSRAEIRALIVVDDYIVGPEDILEISVWRNPDLSREVFVRPDGRISLPLIGDVKAVGLTTAELRDRITKKLKEYKENPTVAIIVKEIRSYFFTVQGAIGGGGEGGGGKIPLLSHTTLVQAIGLAGGLSPDAVRSRITIFRLGRSGDAPKKIVVSYDEIILRGGENIVLKPGDTIVVPSETMVLLP